METSSPVLQVQHLIKEFSRTNPVRAVDDISFSLGEGEVLGLLGPNGAGKTTTIRMLISVLKPTSGTITIFGRELRKERSRTLQDVAFASTYTNLPLFLTVEENLHIHGMLFGMPRAERAQRMKELLGFFEVYELRNNRVNQLSAGQRTRVMLAKAFLPRPKIALLDEPTASLDPDIALEVRAFVNQQRKKEGVSILFSSHNMREVAELCDRVIFLKAGKIVAVNSPLQLAAEAKQSIIHLKNVSLIEKLQDYAAQHSIRRDVQGSEVFLHVSEGGEAKVLTELVELGVRFSAIAIEKPSLEDFFLKLTKRETMKEVA